MPTFRRAAPAAGLLPLTAMLLTASLLSTSCAGRQAASPADAAAATAAGGTTAGQPGEAMPTEPPVAPREPVTTEVHGRTLTDPYAWLRQRDEQRVIDYLEAENRYTEASMAHTEALQQEIYDEMVGRIKETDLSVPYRDGAFLYYSRTEEGEQYPIYCRKPAGTAAGDDPDDGIEEVILDLNQLSEELAPGSEYFSLGGMSVSPNGNLLAFSYDIEGDELYTLRIKELGAGRILADEIAGVSYGIEWGNDNQTLFYVTRDEAARPHKLHRHRLGTDPAVDELLHHEQDQAFFLGIDRTRSGRFLVLQLDSATTSEAHYLDADRPGGDFQVIAPRRHEVEYSVEHRGEHFYIRTNDGAKNFKLLRVPVAEPTAEPTEIIPHRDEVTLEGVDLFARHMVVYLRWNALRLVRVTDLVAGESHDVSFPEPVYTVYPGVNRQFDSQKLRLRYASMVTPTSIFDYDMDARTRELLKQTEVLGGYDPALYTSERISARAGDGTPIPISLVYRKGLERDGANPCLLYSYGSYGASSEPGFSTSRLTLLDRGFVFAIAHIRGGGEMGERWHDEGKLLNKKNTFTDFIDAGEHLIAEGYTSPARLSILGGSAGGLLIGAVVNMRPELFGAAVAQVPFVDVINTMLDPTIPLTVIEYEEWGNPNEQEYFEYMLSYSPYDNVAAQRYPQLLITAGLNDPRVAYWEPAKWTAKLRATKVGDDRLLLKTNMGAGHGGASGRYDAIKERAFVYTFILDALGVAP